MNIGVHVSFWIMVFSRCWWEFKLVHPLWKKVWRFLKKLRIKLPYHPAIPLLGIYPKEKKTLIHKDILYIYCDIIYNSQDIETPTWPSMDEWIKRYISIYTMEYYSAIKKDEILSFVTTWMDLEGIMLSEINQIERDKYCTISLICGI